ncbi:recombinase family protein [Mesorhizobium dulcispinae]|uniref:recombinase family protein n=1 Tax=Mesorhizobium dulcispinae TaxID=3072316 RepID=UPI002A246B6F|nr:recombinase family protein [Mesorhizobium sp. VK23D]MDX8517193.1 recombinase family protein [Mesorhizobium sp. VK23D]
MKKLDILHSHSYRENVETVAISYLRWSSAIQGEGDSLRRQTSKTNEWLAAHPNVRLAHELVDAGVSAFKGKNVKDGALGAFLAAIQEGRIPKGTYLLVESLDRISRLTPAEALAIFLQIINSGVNIVTLMDGQEYRAGQLDISTLIISITKMAMAHEEVVKRSERIRESWVGRTKKAREKGKHVPGNPPSWLYEDANGNLQEDDAKVVIVQRIFDLCISGVGLNAIAQTLNEAGVPPLSLHKRKSIKNRSNFWTVTSVACILRYKAVFGEYHPKHGEPWIAFPVIVPKEDFYRAEAARTKRHNTARGRNGKHYHNLFKGIAKCSVCGESMTIKNGRNRRSPNRPLQLKCVGGINKCSAKPWNYDVFETAFMSFVNEIDLNTIIHGGSGSTQDKITTDLQSLQGERSNLMKVEDSYLKAIDEDREVEPIYRERIKNNRKKINAIIERIKALESDRNRVQAERRASNELLPVEIPKDATMRKKVAEHIRTIVDSVTLKRDSSSKFGSSFTVHFAGGATRTVHVDYTNAKKPYAVTGAHGGVDIIPADKETALDMRDYMIGDITKEIKWAIDNARTDEQREQVRGVIEKFGELIKT